MASLLKPWFTCLLPAGGEVVTHNGRPHVRLVMDGRKALFPLAKCGTRYLRKAAV